MKLSRALWKFTAFAVFFSFQPLPVHALSYNPNKVISDDDFFGNTMSLPDIQSFLERKKSTLANYTAQDPSGAVRRASEIIHDAAEKNGINARVLLVLLQKEQSLIENPRPTQYNYDWATGYSRCDSCSASDPVLAVNKGFNQQVQKAAARKMYYISHPWEFNFRPGETRAVDGQPITPENKATAALYNYTPHIRGNFSFWKLWVRYFERVYPDGTLVKTKDDPRIWLIEKGNKRLFASLGALLSRYALSRVITVEQGDLDKYVEGSRILFPQYSLLQAKSGAIFLLVDDKKYGIPSRTIFKKIGFNPEEVIKATDQELTSIADGGLIGGPEGDPRGELIQDPKTGGIFYVEQEVKHPILERAILRTNFQHYAIKRAKKGQLEKLAVGSPILFSDGTLLAKQDDPAVYIISNGERRPFASGNAFQSLGYQWNQIVRTSGVTLSLHPQGPMVDLGAHVPDELPIQLAENSK